MQIEDTNIPVSQYSYQWLEHESGTRYKGPLSVLKRRIEDDGMQYIPQFAHYPHKSNTTSATVVDVLQVINIMKRNTLKAIGERILAARIAGDDKLKDQLKSNLPYITHSGIFIPRNNASLVLPNFCYQIDIDKIKNPDEILERVKTDPQLKVLFAAKSISGNGVKGLLFLKTLMFLRESWPWENYKKAYHEATDILEEYFLVEYGVKIDSQMKAISQPFYLYYAPNLFVPQPGTILSSRPFKMDLNLALSKINTEVPATKPFTDPVVRDLSQSEVQRLIERVCSRYPGGVQHADLARCIGALTACYGIPYDVLEINSEYFDQFISPNSSVLLKTKSVLKFIQDFRKSFPNQVGAKMKTI